MIASFFLLVGVPMYMLAAGSLCDSVVTPEVQRMGSAFVCGFTDSLTFFWTLVFGAVDCYLIYIVWSAAEEVGEAPYPELMKYSEASTLLMRRQVMATQWAALVVLLSQVVCRMV